MHLNLSPELQGNAAAEEAARIVGKCVHCGFCNASCPTYRLLGDELDGPRGRIWECTCASLPTPRTFTRAGR